MNIETTVHRAVAAAARLGRMHELALDVSAEWEFLELVIDRSELTREAEAIRAPLLAALRRAALASEECPAGLASITTPTPEA